MKYAILFSMGVFIFALAAMTISVIATDGLDILSIVGLGVVGLLAIGFFSAMRSEPKDFE